jgi:hypothetical protein
VKEDPRIESPEGPEKPRTTAGNPEPATCELPPELRTRSQRKRVTGGQPGNQNARKHGAAALKRLVSLRGLSVIDGRSEVGRALREKRAELEAHVGENRMSEPRRILIEQIVRRLLLLESVDAWLFEQQSLVNKRKRSLIPALAERERLAAGLSRDLEAIGLDRAKRERQLEEIFPALKENGNGHGASPRTAPRDDEARG